MKIQVLDALTGKPLSDAVVTLSRNGAEATAVTDGEGRCEAEATSAVLDVEVEREGYAVLLLTLVPLAELVLHMQPQAATRDVVLPPPAPREVLGAIAFGAYNASRGGKNHLGQPTPPWEALPPEIREAWCAAAQAVAETAGAMRGGS